jgi:hypothetical protein
MSPPFPSGPGLSAPDLIGPTSIVEWPVVRTPGRGHRRARPFRHVHLEIDLEPDVVRDASLPVFRQMEALIRERQVVEIGDLLRLVGETLHALASAGFSRVDHWEVEPGGWLPLPEPTHPGIVEPVGHMLRALRDDRWHQLAGARSFGVRLSGRAKFRGDLLVRRVHRERHHSITLDLRGVVRASDVKEIVGALRSRLPVLRSQVTEFSFD